jgi:predicted Zn-dependent peptidase
VSTSKSHNPILHEKLSNGLTVIGEVNKSNQSAAIGYFVRTGSRDETEQESGVSHFLEHMIFKGTEKRNALEITFELGNMGAQANAYTSEENTVYYGAVTSEYVPHFQELLSDMIRPALDPQEFETEKKVILEEIALYQDRPHFYLFERAMRDYFAPHPAGNSVLGSTSSISALTRDQMHAYYTRRYAPSNMVLVATGNFEWERLLSDARLQLGSWQDHSAERKIERHSRSPISKTYYKKNISQAHYLLVTSGASATENHRYALSLLSLIIGDHSGSKFYWELIQKGLVESCGADNDEKDGTGVFYAHASLGPERVSEVKEIIASILAKPLDFSDEDLERARTKVISRIIFNGESPLGRLMSIGTQHLYREKVNSLTETVEAFKKITRADIEKALAEYPLTNWSEFTLLPEENS